MHSNNNKHVTRRSRMRIDRAAGADWANRRACSLCAVHFRLSLTDNCLMGSTSSWGKSRDTITSKPVKAGGEALAE